MQRKSVLPILVLILSLVWTVPVLAQGSADPCAPDTIIATFVEAANNMALDGWATDYTASECPAFSIDAATSLKTIYDTMQLKSFTSGTAALECQPQTIIETLNTAMTDHNVFDWQLGYPAAECPEFVAEGVAALARVYETASLSYAPASAGDVVYEGDVVVLQTVTADGIVENWNVDHISQNGEAFASIAGQAMVVDGVNTGEIGYITLNIAESYSAIIPLNVFRSVEKVGERLYTVSLYDPATTLTGDFATLQIDDIAGNYFSPSDRDTIILTTLPANLEGMDTPSFNQVWTVTINDQVFSVAQPRFALRAGRTRSNCIGACGYTTTLNRPTLGIQITGNDAVTDAEFNTIAKVILNAENVVSVTLPNGYELSGLLSLDRRQSNIYLVADVVSDAGLYLYTLLVPLNDDTYPITLEKVAD